jgi:hypothetical protein
MGFSPESYTFMTMGRLLRAEENKIEQAAVRNAIKTNKISKQ